MDTAEAFQIVLDLAKQYPCCMTDREKEAIAIVEDIAVNEYGDD